ncbi:hypothetical protein Ae201684P_000174 [Aphanomyces euteiches]|nr:hypothetical protein Ae201684P_000174 [Aphanomyces euteiches]
MSAFHTSRLLMERDLLLALLVITQHANSVAGTTTTSSTGVLTTHTETPPVAQTTMDADLLQAFQIVTQLGVQDVGNGLRALAGLEVLLSVEEPSGDLELGWVLDDRDQTFDFIVGQFTSTLGDVHFGLLADHDGEAATNTLDGGQSDPSLAAAVNVRIQNTKNMLEIGSHNERLSYMHEWECTYHG